MQIYKTEEFAEFAKKESISDKLLVDAIRLAQGGKVDADLKGGIIIQRIKRQRQGKDGGYRAIIIFKQDEESFFVSGYVRRDQNRLSKEQIDDYRKIATDIRSWDKTKLQAAIKQGLIIKVDQND